MSFKVSTRSFESEARLQEDIENGVRFMGLYFGYHETREENLLGQMVEYFEPLVNLKVTKKLKNLPANIEKNDLLQDCRIAVMKFLRKPPELEQSDNVEQTYEHYKHILSYLNQRIEGQIIDSLRAGNETYSNTSGKLADLLYVDEMCRERLGLGHEDNPWDIITSDDTTPEILVAA